MTTAEHVCSLFAPGLPKPTLLLGAGASKKSGIPLSGEIVEIAARWAFCRDNGHHPDDPSVVRSDWLAWLHAKPWYRPAAGPADNYSAAVENLLQPRQARKDFFLKAIKPGVPASAGYERLLRLVDAGVIDTVLTTNFDAVFPDLYATQRRPHHMDVVRTPADYTMLSTAPQYPQYIYLHGTVEHYSDQNLLDEVQRLDSTLVRRLTPLLRDRPLIVVGYRGAEPSIMRHLLIEQAGETDQFRKGIFWCTMGESQAADLHPLIHELHAAIRTNLQLVPIAGFDQFIDHLHSRLAAEQQRPIRVRASNETSEPTALPLDMQPLREAALDELDWVRIQEVLPVYCREMAVPVPRSPIARDWMVETLCRLDLAYRSDGVTVPTVAGYLLFADQPNRRIRSGVASVRIEGREEAPLTGNLWSQLEALTALVDDVNRPFRLKGAVSEDVFPYPKLALKELIVNALVHRSYDGDHVLAFDVEPTFIRITNPGGLVDRVFAQVNLELQKQIEEGLRGLKGYRNPVIADLFYGAGAMDKKGSGLPDVQAEAKRNGQQVSFGPTHDNTTFRAVIYRRPEQVDAETRTAAPLRNTTKYSTNLLEVAAMPEKLWVAHSTVESRGFIWHAVSPALPPPFVLKKGGQFFTFCDLADGHAVLTPFVDKGTIESRATADLARTEIGRRDLVWLLNDCLYRLLERRGLIVDRSRKRAYFPRKDGAAREVKYQASFRQATRTVTKPVISKKTGRTVYWEHEALWFGFEYFGGTWALRILPGYVFTIDGEENLLHHTRVGALATRKAARDYNLQVHNDLVFWAWVLAGGQDSFSVSTGADAPVLIRGTVSSCELAMPIAAEADFRPEPPRWQELELQELENEIAEAAEQDLEELEQEQGRAH